MDFVCVVAIAQRGVSHIIDVLAYLMEEHRLCLSDLPEIGTSATIEAILNKHQALTLSQVQQLAQRFQVQPQVFLD